MTRLLDDTGEPTPGRARRKVAELIGDPFVRSLTPTRDGWIVRWGDGDIQTWQNVGRIDGVAWAERVG